MIFSEKKKKKGSFLNSWKVPWITFQHKEQFWIFSIALKNSFLSNWRCQGGSRTAATGEMEFFVTILHNFMLLIAIVTVSFMLDGTTALDPTLFACKFWIIFNKWLSIRHKQQFKRRHKLFKINIII